MYKSWSQQYSFINSGDQMKETQHFKYSNNEKNYQKGYTKSTDDKNTNEKFYKYRQDSTSKNKLLGKSINKSNWTILKDDNGKEAISNQNYDNFTYESEFKKNLKHTSLLDNKKPQPSINQLKEYSIEENQDQILNFFNSKQPFGSLFDIKYFDEFNYDDMFDEDFFNMD